MPKYIIGNTIYMHYLDVLTLKLKMQKDIQGNVN